MTPASNNGYRFELFVHNFLSYIEDGKLGVIKVPRDEEYSVVKKPEGAP